MIKINLLPHREEKRRQRKTMFYALLGVAAAMGGVILVILGLYNAQRIFHQTQTNSLIQAQNQQLDISIHEIASLREDISLLKSRQQAVEDLQENRNQPVYLLSELVNQTPEGVYLYSVKQEGQVVTLMGYAQSNERVSVYLDNLAKRSDWLDKPDLIVINAAGIGQGKDAKKVFNFTVNVNVKRSHEKDVVKGQAAQASTSKKGI